MIADDFLRAFQWGYLKNWLQFPDIDLLFLEVLGSKSNLSKSQTKPHFSLLWKFHILFHLSLQSINKYQKIIPYVYFVGFFNK